MMGRLSCVVVVLLAAAACGKVNDPGVTGDAPGTPIDAAPDACVPRVRIGVQFMATKIVGSGSSTLDTLLNHPNGFILTVPTWTEERGIDNITPTSSFKTAIKGTYMMDYTGQDGAFLDTEIGQFLTVGGAFRQSVIDLSDNKSVFLYVLPAQTNQHPYMDVRCNNAPFTTDPQSNFPVLKTFTATGCSVTFFDFRPGTQRNVIAEQNTTVELGYQSCQ